LTLQKADPNCQDLVMWDDGTVAAGMRKLGKGMVLDFGMWDSDALHFEGAGLDEDQACARPKSPAHQVMMRSFVSNNGLYDVWTMWNQDERAGDHGADLSRRSSTPLDCHGS
jgi:hypothetical protein